MTIEKAALPRAIICVDFSNYHYYLNKRKWKIDWKKFINYFQCFYTLEAIFYYEGVPSKAVYLDRHRGKSEEDFNLAKMAKLRFHQSLKRLSIKVRSKPVSRVYDDTEGRFKHKCNFDVDLTIDAVDNLDRLDTFILCSGDGDFTRLIKYTKGRHKKAVVVAPSERLAHTLENAANKVIYLEDIRHEIEQS
jgi:uncharacterized LabA/DUF88 family protein